MNKALAEICEYCDGTLKPKVVRAQFHFMGETIFIDGVPALVCNQCGEQYFEARVYKHLEEIAHNRKRISKTICFPLADYDAA